MKRILYILCGLPGSGKTEYAKSLENNSNIRLTLDEELIKRYGSNFDAKKYEEYEANIEIELLKKARFFLTSGHNVVLDYGFWKKEKRDRYKKLADRLGVDWKLMYFECPTEELRKRLKKRNNQKKSDAQIVTSEMLDNFIVEFEVPKEEGEEIVNTIYML
jgi:predicted kinase